MHRYTVLFEDREARRIEALAGQYGLTEQEVLRQLVELGFEALADQPNGPPLPDRDRDGDREVSSGSSG